MLARHACAGEMMAATSHEGYASDEINEVATPLNIYIGQEHEQQGLAAMLDNGANDGHSLLGHYSPANTENELCLIPPAAAQSGQLDTVGTPSNSLTPYERLDLSQFLTQDNKIRCPVCGKEFWDRSKLKRHYLIHTGEKPFHCHYCSFRCNQKDNLKLHVFSKHAK